MRGESDNGERGQSLVELALVLPLLLAFLLMVIEGGFLFRSHNALVAATWAGARFALDGGSDPDVVYVIQNSGSGLSIVAGRADIYVVRGRTDLAGTIVSWSPTKVLGTGPAEPSTTRADLQAGFATWPTAANVSFVLVEVDYQYTGVTGAMPISLPIRSYAVVQRL